MNRYSIYTTSMHLLIIAVFGIVIYSNSFTAPFTLDDEIYIIQNPAIKSFSYFLDPSSVLDLTHFTADFRYAFITRIAGYFTFALNYHMHGLDVTGYHVVNLLIHTVNALLVYFLIRQLFNTPFFSKVQREQKAAPSLTPDVIALFSALLFVSHPVQTQAVTYIYQRVTSLVTLCYLLSLLAYAKSRLSSAGTVRYGLYGISLISGIIAMLVKEISFTLPVTIMLLEFLFFDGTYRKRAVLMLPFGLTLLVIPVTLLTAQGTISIDALEQSMEILASYPDAGRMEYLFTQFRVIVTYIRLLVLPINQNLDYDYPLYNSFFEPSVFSSFLFLLSLFCLGVYVLYRTKREAREGRYGPGFLGFGILWFFITLSVESSVIPIKDAIFEHRLYLPSVGFIMAFMAVIIMMVRIANSRRAVNIIAAVIIVIIIALGGATYARNSVWRNYTALWEDVVKKSPFKARPHVNLGIAYDKEGRIDEAIGEYLRAIQIRPDAELHYNLATAYDKKGLIDEAIREYIKAIQIRPDFDKAHNNLGILYGRQGRAKDAEREFLAAIQINPAYANAHNNLGILYRIQGRIEDAIREFQTTLDLNPDHAGARKNLERIRRMKK